MGLQHPMITQIERTGYPNMMAQPEHAGSDFYGTEIFSNDDIINLPNGEMLHEDNLDDYLIEELSVEFDENIAIFPNGDIVFDDNLEDYLIEVLRFEFTTAI